MIFVAKTAAHRANLAAWLSERVEGAEGGFGQPFQALGVFRGADLAAAVVYSGFRGRAGHDLQCEISFAAASPRWASKENVQFILWYGLVNLDCRRMTAITHANNLRVHKLLTGIGFMKEGRHRDMFADGDAITFGMTRRWFLKSKHNGWKIKSLAA